MLEGEYTPLGVAKALYYPRVLGTSINTSLGSRVQKMFIDLEIAEAKGSLSKGINIEFTDQLDKRHKFCQLKSGPNTINSGDVKSLVDAFNSTIRLARTNNMYDIVNTDFIVGVLCGLDEELSQHYQSINAYFPVYAGKDLWHHLTGDPVFYDHLIQSLTKTIDRVDINNVIEEGCASLASQIKASSLFNCDE